MPDSTIPPDAGTGTHDRLIAEAHAVAADYRTQVWAQMRKRLIDTHIRAAVTPDVNDTLTGANMHARAAEPAAGPLQSAEEAARRYTRAVEPPCYKPGNPVWMEGARHMQAQIAAYIREQARVGAPEFREARLRMAAAVAEMRPEAPIRGAGE